MVNREEIFIRQINEKREEAFHELFHRFYNYLVVFAFRRVQQKEVAEDIVQEVFVSVWEGEKEFNSYYGFKAFLYEAVSHRCLDYLKHLKVEKRYAASVLKEWEEKDVGDELGMVEEEMYRELHLAVQELPERCRAVFELYLQGKKNEEIAGLLTLSVLTVKTHKTHAARYLKKRLGEIYFLLFLIKFF